MPSPFPKSLLSASPIHSSWSLVWHGPLGPTVQSADSWRRRALSFCLSTLWMNKGIKRRQPRGPWATARTRCTLKEGMRLEMSSLPWYLGATCSFAALYHARLSSCGTAEAICTIYLLKPPLWRAPSKDIRDTCPEALQWSQKSWLSVPLHF